MRCDETAVESELQARANTSNQPPSDTLVPQKPLVGLLGNMVLPMVGDFTLARHPEHINRLWCCDLSVMQNFYSSSILGVLTLEIPCLGGDLLNMRFKFSVNTFSGVSGPLGLSASEVGTVNPSDVSTEHKQYL